MAFLASLADHWFLVDEYVGVVLGLLVVVCLILQKLWAWPLGVAYVLVTLPQLWQAQLYANFALHLVGFLPLNLYGWYHWLFGGERRDDLPVGRASTAALLALGALCVGGALGLGWSLASREALDLIETAAARASVSIVMADAAFPYWDNGVLVMSLAAMWLTARKKIENWIVWVAVNVVSVPLYYAQDLPWYAILYCVYIPMAVWGYASWLRSMRADNDRQLARTGV